WLAGDQVRERRAERHALQRLPAGLLRLAVSRGAGPRHLLEVEPRLAVRAGLVAHAAADLRGVGVGQEHAVAVGDEVQVPRRVAGPGGNQPGEDGTPPEPAARRGRGGGTKTPPPAPRPAPRRPAPRAG